MKRSVHSRAHARASTRARPRTSTRSGMTLVEVLVAMGILLVGLTAILGLMTTGAALSRSAVLRTAAAASTQAVVEDMRETLFPIDPEGGLWSRPGPPQPIVERALPGEPNIVYSATVTENPDRPGQYRVDVEMSWQSAGVRRARTFSTLLVRELPFGERLRRRFVEGVPDVPNAPGAASRSEGPGATTGDKQ